MITPSAFGSGGRTSFISPNKKELVYEILSFLDYNCTYRHLIFEERGLLTLVARHDK